MVSHARCPVLVIRDRFGSAGAPVAAAFEEASVRGVPLVAVHA